MMHTCTTVRRGHPCQFMTKKGCGYKAGACKRAVQACEGCGRLVEIDDAGLFCSVFPEPALKWRNGSCNMATHVVQEIAKEAKINPIKASKRGAGAH